MRQPLQEGDRVVRLRDLDGTTLRRGVVTGIYHSTPSHDNTSTLLYEVEWDDTHCRERGYIRLELEEL